jgi:hypothetical protein
VNVAKPCRLAPAEIHHHSLQLNRASLIGQENGSGFAIITTTITITVRVSFTTF